MNDDTIEQAKQRLNDAIKETQAQGQEAAKQMSVLLGHGLEFGAKKIREAADKAAQAIREDINKRS